MPCVTTVQYFSVCVNALQPGKSEGYDCEVFADTKSKKPMTTCKKLKTRLSSNVKCFNAMALTALE